MGCLLIIAVLTIQSSYAENQEWELTDTNTVPDTVQMWIGPSKGWRIRTYAKDHDIHIHSVEFGEEPLEPAFERSTRNNYGDVLASYNKFELKECSFGEMELLALKNAGLAPILEDSKKGFLFWKPDLATYSTKSQPKE